MLLKILATVGSGGNFLAVLIIFRKCRLVFLEFLQNLMLSFLELSHTKKMTEIIN